MILVFDRIAVLSDVRSAPLRFVSYDTILFDTHMSTLKPQKPESEGLHTWIPVDLA